MGGGVAPSRRYGSRQNRQRWPRHSRRSRLIPLFLVLVAARLHIDVAVDEIAPELTGHGLPLSKCEAYNRVYDQLSKSH